jgi:hypothetical protein
MDLIENVTRVEHRQFGKGIIKYNDGNVFIVDFEKYGEKKFTGKSILDKQLWIIKEVSVDSNKPKEFNKSNNIIGSYNVLEAYSSTVDLIFNESYIVIGEKMAAPSIRANYNLIVIGSLYCDEISINGSLIIIGNATLKKLICEKEVVCTGKLSITEGEVEASILANELKSNSLTCRGNINIQTVVDIKDVLDLNGIMFATEGILGKGKIEAESVIAGEFINFDGITPKKTFEISEVNSNTDILKMTSNTIPENYNDVILKKLTGKVDLSSDAKKYEFFSIITDISDNDVSRSNEWKYLIKNIFEVLNKNDIDNLRDCLLVFYAEKFLPKEIKYNIDINKVFSTLLPKAIDKIDDLVYTASDPYDIAFSIKVIEEYGTEISESKSRLLDKVFEFMGIKFTTVKKYLTG